MQFYFHCLTVRILPSCTCINGLMNTPGKLNAVVVVTVVERMLDTVPWWIEDPPLEAVKFRTDDWQRPDHKTLGFSCEETVSLGSVRVAQRE